MIMLYFIMFESISIKAFTALTSLRPYVSTLSLYVPYNVD